MPLKIIFLDVDGVLNCTPCVPTGCPRIVPHLAEQLNQIIRRTGATVVMISTWRNWTHLGWLSLEGWQCLLGTHGVDCKVVAVLPQGDKESRLLEWLGLRGQVEDFVVLDDKRIHTRQVVTDGYTGLTTKNVEEAVRILGEKPCP
ncbi:hypothetical protein LCGC14_0336170 [marine sediment metagenome]|uniref:FCP1 homology domain-containing protein n=1 Tax=marine sediment metagenome TaxID=412755 RepID=A0A0F9TXW1_9ZZZZ